MSPIILNHQQRKLNTNNMVNFLDLPGEIRNLIYDHLLVFEAPIAPWAKKEVLPVNLLYTNNKTIYQEFGSLFYSRITFDFSTNRPNCEIHHCPACSASRMASFLDKIGQNAKHIQSIKIDFPQIICEPPRLWEESWLSKPTVKIVKKIARTCPDLKRLILGSTLMLNILLDVAVEEPDETVGLLYRIDTHLRRISSLRSIFVRVPNCEEYYKLMDEMEYQFGWEVEMIDAEDFKWMSDDYSEGEEDEDDYDDEDYEDDEDEDEDSDDDDDY